MNGLTALFLKSGPLRIFAALGATALVAALVFGFMFRVGAEEKALLFADVSMKDAAEITARLDQAQIPYDLRGDGSAIFVPQSKVLSARMMLSAEGLPASGSVGYEIFDKPDALGSTQFVQNMNRLRALEGELARSIASLNGVESARVHLVLPERRLFEREAEQASASIVLKLSRNVLNPGEVRAIRNLVAGATPGLAPGRVTILDESGRLLAAAETEDGAGGEGADVRQTAAEDRIRRVVQDIVEGVVGPGAARVQVTAELDLNRVTQNSETFDPEGRVVRSTRTLEESANEQDRASRAGTTAANNIPDGRAGAEEGGGKQNASNRTEETVNYEISKTVKTEIIEGGRIRRLSVAVAVDGVTPLGADGKPGEWTARAPEEMARLTQLVRSAVGYDEARGDKVEVVNVRFARAEAQGAEASKPALFDMKELSVMRLVELAAALIVVIAVLLFVVRPLVSSIMKSRVGDAGGGALLPAGPGAAALAAPGAPPLAAALPVAGPEIEPVIDVARIHGQVKASSVKKVAEVIEQHPDESVSILRGWLNDAV